jgi:hypothetical protein
MLCVIKLSGSTINIVKLVCKSGRFIVYYAECQHNDYYYAQYFNTEYCNTEHNETKFCVTDYYDTEHLDA